MQPRARRCLFGPADGQRTSGWLRDRLLELRSQQETTWNFDFHSGRPLTTPDAVFEFAVVTSVEMPAFYRMRVYSPISSVSDSASDSENRIPPVEGAIPETPANHTIPLPKFFSSTSYQTKLTDFMKVEKRRQMKNGKKASWSPLRRVPLQSNKRVLQESIFGKTPA